MGLEKEEFDISKMVRSVVSEFSESRKEREVEVSIIDNVTFRGDSRLLRAVVENLFGNAWKFTGKTDNARIEFGLTGSDSKSAFFFTLGDKPPNRES